MHQISKHTHIPGGGKGKESNKILKATSHSKAHTADKSLQLHAATSLTQQMCITTHQVFGLPLFLPSQKMRLCIN